MASLDNPYAAPSSELRTSADDAPVMRRRKQVILEKSAAWPARCVCCNAPTHNHKRYRLSYVTPWIFLSLLINILLTLLLYFIFRKTFSYDVPYCSTHAKRRSIMLALTWGFMLLTFGIVVFGATHPGTMSVLSLVGLVLLVLSGVFATQAYRLQVVKFRKNKVWISGAGKAFLDSLPEYQAN